MSVQKMLAALTVFRQAVPYAPTNTLIAFLYVAQNEGCYVMDVQRACGMEHTATARAIGLLYKHYRGKPGKDLVISRVDFRDQRHKQLFLTPKGARLYEAMKEVLDGSL
jgi:DNA-binding MarR family transcriptional regulator